MTVTDSSSSVESVNVLISSGYQSGDVLTINGQTDGDIQESDGSTIHYHFDPNPGAGQSGATPVEFSAPPSLHGRWDKLRVEETLLNLVSNAVKYGAGQPVRVEVAPHHGALRLVVSDKGPGIKPEDQEKIFQPFARLTESQQGVGLGLWIVRKIVQAHGGTIELASIPGDGTRVTVVLPSGP